MEYGYLLLLPWKVCNGLVTGVKIMVSICDCGCGSVKAVDPGSFYLQTKSSDTCTIPILKALC